MDHATRHHQNADDTTPPRPAPCVVCGYETTERHPDLDVHVHRGPNVNSCESELRERWRASVLAHRWMHGPIRPRQ
jgi:hypothetical protein